MSPLWQCIVFSAPLFAVIGAGYAIARLPFWRPVWSGWASKLVFNVALPALLFRMMSATRGRWATGATRPERPHAMRLHRPPGEC